MSDHPTDTDAEDFDFGPSKTQLKKASQSMQDLGHSLSQLNDQQLARLPLSDALRSALDIARGMRANAARKRQIQYIGKLLRNDNGEQITEALAQLQAETSNSHQWAQLSDHWATRLIEEVDALASFVDQHPQADRQQLRTLVRNCQKLTDPTAASPALKKLRKWLRECLIEHSR